MTVRSPGARFWLSASIVYLAMGVAATWPAARGLGRSVPGVGGDVDHHLWNLWYVERALTRGDTDLARTTLLYHPVGVSLAFHSLDLGCGLLAQPLRLLGASLATAYSEVWLSSFVLAGLGGALLGWRTSESRHGALVAGACFSLCPYHLVHGLGHLELASIQWLPLSASLLLGAFPLVLHDVAPAVRIREAALAGAAFGMAAITSPYYLAFLLVFAALWVLALSVSGSRRSLRPLPALVFAAFLAASAAPTAWPMLKAVASGERYYRLPGEEIYSADLAGLFLPATTSTAFARVASTLTGGAGFYGSSAIENVVSVGLVTLALAIAGFTRAPSVFRYASGTFVLLALGPRLRILGHALPVPLPYALLSRVPVVNAIRVPARYVIMVELCLIPMVAAGAARLARGPGVRARWITAALLAAILLAEGAAPYPVRDATIPELYQKMAEDPAPGAVMDVPYLYLRRNMYPHTAHGRPIAGGFVSRVPPEARAAFKERVERGRDLLYSANPGEGERFRQSVQALGIRYVIVDRLALAQEPRAKPAEARLREAFPEGPWASEGMHDAYRVPPAKLLHHVFSRPPHL